MYNIRKNNTQVGIEFRTLNLCFIQVDCSLPPHLTIFISFFEREISCFPPPHPPPPARSRHLKCS